MMTDQRSSHLPAVPLSAQQQHERQQQQQAAIDRAKTRARKPTDKTLPEGVEDCIISDGVQRYRELRDFERRLDATITRKRLDVVDSVGRSVKVGSRFWVAREREGDQTDVMGNSDSRLCAYGSQTLSRTKAFRAAASPAASTSRTPPTAPTASRSKADY